MPRIKNVNDLPEDVRDFESGNGELTYGKELDADRKQRRINNAKKELAETDTVVNKAKAIGSDVMDTLSAATFRKPYNPRSARVEHDDKVKRLKEEAGMKKGGKVSSASKRADGCCVKGKTKGKMV